MAEYFYQHPHDNVVAALAVVTDSANALRAVYYEFCDFTLSKHWKDRQGILTDALTRRLLHDLLRGLAHMHHHGIIHRDIKPANLMLRVLPDSAMRLKIADFGWNRAVVNVGDEIATPGAVTPVYRAPEIWLGKPYSFPVDVWSAGLVARELLSGWRLYELLDVISDGKADQKLDVCRAAGGHIDGGDIPGTVYQVI